MSDERQSAPEPASKPKRPDVENVFEVFTESDRGAGPLRDGSQR